MNPDGTALTGVMIANCARSGRIDMADLGGVGDLPRALGGGR
jgi:hypothetical protein